ncbi:MAG: periplasmic heavy metal sensor [Alphaproteobacteria bacterium]
MPNNFLAPHHKTSVLAGTLLVSVIMNLFLVGVVAGIVPGMKHKFFGPMALAAPHGEYMVEGMTRYLDQPDAAAFRDSVQSQVSALKQAHERVRQATKDVAAVFEQDPPDPTALQTALDHLGEAKAEVNAAVGKIVQDADAKLSPEGRHRLAELTR